MPTYNNIQFEPPAPLAYVILRNPSNMMVEFEVPMLLDSGADVTLIPFAAVESLQIPVASDKRYELASFDGQVSIASVAHLELLFCDRTFRGQFLLIDQTWGILGRNVLNSISILLDGPKQIWKEYKNGT